LRGCQRCVYRLADAEKIIRPLDSFGVLLAPLFFDFLSGGYMTINQLWYFGIFIWGLVSAWAVIEGLKG